MLEEEAPHTEQRFHIFDSALPNPIRLRHILGAALSTQLYFLVVITTICLVCRMSFLQSIGFGTLIGGRIGGTVAIGFWLIPIVSCIFETIALRRVTPGVLYKVTPTLMATYGFTALYGLYLLVQRNPVVAHYVHQHGLASWRGVLALTIAGFALGWVVRHLLIACHGRPLFFPGKSLFQIRKREALKNRPNPIVAFETPEDLRSGAPLRVPKF